MTWPFRWFGSVVYNRAITAFLIVWVLAAIAAFFWIVDLADPCPGTNLVCPGVEWIRPGYLAEDFRNLLWAASLVFGGAGAGAALINALRRTRLMQAEHALAQRGQDAETFSRAVEQLGSKETAIRLGAIYALEGLMRSAFADGGDKTFGRQIGETLAAFVREQSAEEVRKAPDAATLPDDYEGPRLAVDREAAVAVLARSWPFEHRPFLYTAGGVDLSSARLARLRLPDGADLREFDLSNADLREAQLFGVELEGAWLRSANLQKVELTGATLRGALLDSANLQKGKLAGADLSFAHISYADLEGALLQETNCQSVELHGVNLSAAKFVSHNASDPAENLNLEQVAKARWRPDRPPALPPEIDRPHRGDGKPLREVSPLDESWMTVVGPDALI
ncbi:pentapeptide repeat-containing protein [Glycocaulis sp.]|uniref:pentapeptide repeat-containing protein n=1 Tax=Glycocaulis sp. TaxID=1969725 RepID=UPI003D1DA96D